MSRSALWRQEAGVKEREHVAQDAFQTAVEEGRNVRTKGLVPLYGPTDSFHIHSMLLQCIVKAPYFVKCCNDLKDWNALVDEIYYEVKHVEPWAAAGQQSKTPSSAFCLLLRLLTLRCSERQMCLLLDHKDSPYIRCIGFLYLRYACEPSELWKWIHPYVFDEELVRVRFNPASAEIPMGEYVRNLFGELEYFGTRLPRLPLLVERDLKAKLQQADIAEERAKRHFANSRSMDYFCTLGSRVRAQYEDEHNPLTWYDAVIDRVLTTDPETNSTLRRPKFIVTFPEYGNTEVVTLGDLDMPRDGEIDRNRRSDDRRGQDFHRKDRPRGVHEHDQYRATRDSSHNRRGVSRGYSDRRERSRSREPEQDLGDRRRTRDEFELSANSSGPGNSRKPLHDDGLAERSRPLAPIARQGGIDAPPATKSIEKTPQELAAIAEKKRRLANRYG